MDVTKVSRHFVSDVEEYIEANKKATPLNQMTPSEFLDAYLEWNGVVGYTGSIIYLIQELGWERKEGR